MPGAGVGLLEKLEQEFKEIDQRQHGWNTLFSSIGVESRNPELTSKESLKPRNRGLNRYRNVSPYDHSRIVLLDSSVDYINANLVRVPIAGRQYILGQGPLEHTCGHFWLMVWQQESRAVVMLNRVIENNVVKCHQYWPEKVDESTDYEEVGLRVTNVNERSEGFYVVRTIRVTQLSTGETRDVAQFHYTTWPDFQVPASPAAFLNFLAAVRDCGGLESDVGPAVIHCSAGIGRSGTFCLIDSCLLLVEKGLVTELDVKSILLELRTYRTGLIQTPDQLRFSFLGIIRGAKTILCGSGFLDGSVQEEPEDVEPERKQNNVAGGEESSEEEEESENGKPPTPPPRSDSLTRSFDSSSPPTVEDSSDGSGDELPPSSVPVESSVPNHKHDVLNDVKSDVLNDVKPDETELRKRLVREERRRATEELVSSIKSRQREAEARHRRVATMKELVPKCLMGLTIIGIVAVFSYKYWT